MPCCALGVVLRVRRWWLLCDMHTCAATPAVGRMRIPGWRLLLALVVCVLCGEG